MKKIMPVLLMTTAMLPGCTLMPDYMRPDMPVAQQWPLHEGQEDASKKIADIGWKDFFTSPPLQKAVQTALDNNRDLRVAALNVEAAQALYRVERSDLLPGVSAGGGGSRQKVTEAQSTSNPLFSTNREYITSTYTANVGVTAFELDLFGRIRSLSEAALQEYFATQAAQDAARITLIAETANAYLQWQADRKILKLTEETLAAQEKSYELIARSHESGVASKLDLAQVRTAVETARANKAIFTRRVEQDKNALVLLMGKDDPEILSADTSLDEVKVMESLPVGLPSDVLLSRPDVMQAESRLKSANANIGAARAAFFPTISLTGAFGFASGDLSNLFSSGAAGAWSFAPQITLPIFEGGRNVANLDVSAVRKNIAVAQYEKSIQTAFREVADELAARRTLTEQLNAQRELVKASQEAYDLSNARYKQGIDSFLSVLDAQRTLYGSRQSTIDVEKQQIANLVNLYKALGGGIK